MMKTKKDTIGIRVPDHAIARALIRELGLPILSTSLPGGPFEDAEIIEEQMGNLVDAVVDGGPGGLLGSTVIDLTGNEPELIRKGAGIW